MEMPTYSQLYPKPPFPEPHSVHFWKIEMAVGNGYYIVLPDTWTTKVRAELNFPKTGGNFRAAEYQRGRGTMGPERVLRTSRERMMP